jgi:hypothetical protein
VTQLLINPDLKPRIAYAELKCSMAINEKMGYFGWPIRFQGLTSKKKTPQEQSIKLAGDKVDLPAGGR